LASILEEPVLRIHQVFYQHTTLQGIAFQKTISLALDLQFMQAFQFSDSVPFN